MSKLVKLFSENAIGEDIKIYLLKEGYTEKEIKSMMLGIEIGIRL